MKELQNLIEKYEKEIDFKESVIKNEKLYPALKNKHQRDIRLFRQFITDLKKLKDFNL